MDLETKVREYFAQLESNPYDLAPLGLLEQVFDSQESLDAFVDLLESRAPEVGSPDASARLFLEAARVASTGLQDVARSHELLAQCLEVGEETLVSVEAYLFQLAMANDLAELQDFFIQALEYDDDEVYKSRLFARMGCILEDFIGDPAQADTAYERALDLNPGNWVAIWSRQGLARRTSDWEGLAELLIYEIDQTTDPRRQADLSLAVGEIYRDHLNAEEAAAQCFAFAVEQDPENVTAREALLAMGYEVDPGGANGASDIDVSDVEAEPVEVEPEPVEVEAEPVEGEDTAVDGMEIGEAPMTMDIEEGMLVEEEAPSVPEVPEVDEVEESEESEESEELEGAVEDQQEDPEVEEEEEAVEELAAEEVAEDAAVEEEAVEEDEEEEDEEEEGGRTWRDRFEDLCASAGSLEGLARAARMLARHREDDADVLRLWELAADAGVAGEFHHEVGYLFRDAALSGKVAEVLEARGEASAKARVILFDGDDLEAGKAAVTAAGDAELEGLLADLEEAEANWRKFQRSLEKDREPMEVYLRMADLAAVIGDEDKEVDALRRLERQVDDEYVARRLMELYRRSEKWPMYVDLLKKEAEAIGDGSTDEKVDILYEIIRVYRQEMNHDRMAINVYKEILEIAPEDLQAIDELTAIYDEMNMSSDLISMLQTKAELVKGPKAKVKIYGEIAQLFLEKFRNQAEAIKAYEQVLEIEPHHGEAITFLKEMYEKRRDWESLIDVHKREIATFETDEEAVAGLKLVAELATDKLRKPEVATELWLEVREISPRDSDALDALEKLYEKSRDYEALSAILEQKAPLTEDPAEQMKLYQKLGMLYSDRLDDSERAIHAWRAALELQPDDLKARKALERLFIDNRQWDELEEFYAASDAYNDLVRILATLTGTIKEEEVQLELLLRSARIWREELEDTSRAERELERALQIDPQNQAAAAQLEPIYAEAQDYEKLREAMEIVLSHLEEPAEQKKYQIRLGRLQRDQLEDWRQAFTWFARAYRVLPGEVDVVEELEAAAAASDSWGLLVDHYSDALEEDLSEEVTLQVRLLLGRVLSEELEELDNALEQFTAVLDVEEDNRKALAGMERIHRKAERWDDLMKVYRHRLELEESAEARVGILQGMAHIAEVEANDVATAIARLNEALELDGRKETTLRELHRLYQSEAEYADLADVIRREIDLIERRARLAERRRERVAVDPAVVVDGAVSVAAPAAEAPAEASMFGGEVAEESADDLLADLREEEGDAFAAVEYDEPGEYDGEVEEDAVADVEAAAEDEEVEGAAEVGPESLEDVDLSAEAFYTDEEVERLVALRFELGLVCMDHLGELEEAVDALGKVLSWRPTHVDARSAVETLIEDSLHEVAVARILEPVYEVHGEWEALVRTLTVQAGGAEGADALEIHRRMGTILVEEIGDGERAFHSFAEVVRLDPADEDGRAQAYRVAHELSLWDPFVDLCEEVVPGLEDEDLRVDYYDTLAFVNREFRREFGQARKYLEEIYAMREGDARTLDEMEELFIQTEEWQELLDVVDRKIEHTEDEEAIRSLKFRKARVWEDMLEDPHQAIGIYREILEAEPQNLEAYRLLDGLYEAQEMWSELSSNLRHQLELVGEEHEHDVKCRLARVLEAFLHDAEGAVDLLEEVLGEDPNHSDANQALEAWMYKDSAPRGRISRILEPLYVDREDAEGLTAALEVQVDVSAEADQRVELLQRIAVLHEDVRNDQAEAFRAWARALADGVANEQTLENLYRLADETHGHFELVEVFEEQADAQVDPDVKRDMLRRAAALYLEPLSELDRATERLHAVLELFPADLVTVEELEEIYRHTEAWPQLVEIVVTKAELVEDVEDKRSLLHQAGTLYEDLLSQPEEAIEIYNRALVVDEADAHAIDRLEILHTNLEQWYELLEVYNRKLELAENDEDRKGLLFRMGAIYQEQLQQPQDGIDNYRRVLDLDPAEETALARLDELFEATEQWHELLGILDRQLELSDDVSEQEDLKYRVGRLWEVHLGDGLRAVEVFGEVLATNPDHAPSVEALEGMVERGDHEVEAARVLQPLYQDKGQWEELVHVLRLLIDASDDPHRKVELFTEAAAITEEQLQDPAGAFATYVEALAVDPGREAILDTLERLAAALDGWEVLIGEIDRQLESITDFEAVTGLHLRIARMYEEELDRPQDAIDRFQRVLETEPSEQTAILALDRLYQREGQWEDLAEILKARIYSSEDPAEALELRLRLGSLQQTMLEDADAAITTYQEVLLEDAENSTAIENLETMFMEGRSVERIADILEPFYLERGQHEKLVAIYLQRLEMLEDPFERYEMLMQVARIFLEELNDLERALQAYGAALVERPDDEQVLGDVERLAESTGDWGTAAEYLVEALGSEHNTDESRLGLWIRLARILDQHMGQVDNAEQAYTEALALDSNHGEALEALDRIYLSQARWAELSEILQQRIAGTYDDVEVVDLNYRLAQVFQDQLGDFDRAVDTYERIVTIQPDHEETLQHLEHIHMTLQSWEPLYDVLQRRVELTHDPDEQADLYGRLARIAEEMLDRKLDAVDLWQRVVEVRPDDRDALGELRRLYLEDERWDDLVGVLRREVELTYEPEEQLGLYESLGTIYGEYLHDEVQAQEAWTSVLSLDPEHLEALEALKELTTRQADYQQLAEIIDRLIVHEGIDEERKLALYKELGKVQGEMLMNADAAIEAWTNVVGLEPDNDQALDELEQLFLQESRWEEAAQVLEIKADRIEDHEERIHLLTRVADLWESKLFNRDEAARFYQGILEVEPTHGPAGQALETIYREQGTEEAYAQLATLYIERSEVVEDEFDRLEVLRQAAQVFEENLDQPENSLVVLLSAYGPDTLRDESLSADIRRLARQTGMWDDVVGRCSAILDELDDSLEAADLHKQVGRWRAEELDQPDEAVYHLRRALMIEPENLEVLQELEKLYRKLASWRELAEVIRTEVDLHTEPEEQVELWRKLGEIYEMQLGEIDDAVAAYREILMIDPGDILAMDSLERVFEAFQRWEELVEVLDQKAAATYDPEKGVEIKSRVAQIWEEELQNVEQAILAYRGVLTVDQDQLPALQALERLYMQTEQYNELVDVYEQQLGLTHEPDEQVGLHGKLAWVFEAHFQDLDRAVESYNNVLMVDPANETAIENLERLFRDLERWFELADTIQRHIELVDHAMQKVALYTELGRLQRDQISDAYAAIESLNQALELEPLNPELWSEVAQLHEETSNWEQSVQAYERLVEQIDDVGQRTEVYFRLGQILEGHLHDHANAEEAYMSALRLDPTHEGVLDAVRHLMEIQQQWQTLIRVLKAAEDAHRDLDKKAELVTEIGTIYEEHVDDLVSALRYYEEALEHNPHNPVAARPLIDVYVREQRFEKATPLLEMVLDQYAKSEVAAEEIHMRSLQLAQAYEALAQPERALQQYRNAYELQPTDKVTLQGLGRILYETQEWDQASKVLQALQLHHEDKLDTAELVEVYFELGSIRRHLNDLRKAAQYFDRALEIEQHHKPTLLQRAEVAQEMGKWEEVVHFTRWLLETEEDPTVRFAQLSNIGDLLATKLNQPQQAVMVYQEALDLEPKSGLILRKLLDLYTKTQQWHDAVEVLKRIVEQEQDPSRVATYFYTAAVIYRDKINDPVEAVNLFNAALDADVKMLKAFEAIDRILTEAKSWKELSRAYRGMLHRLKDVEDMEEVKLLLWTNLGEVYRTRRQDLETAKEAYEIAVGLNPSDPKTRLILAELHEKTGNLEGVIRQHRELIALDQFRVESYRKLFKSYIQTKAYDRAWCMAAALSFLQSGSEQEETFFRKYLGSTLQAASGTLNQESYKLLYHPDQDVLITYILSVLGSGLREMYSLPSVKEWGLHKRKDKVDLDQPKLFNKIYPYVAQTMNLLPAPQVYLKADQAMGIRNANVGSPTVIVGGDVYERTNDRELAFMVAKGLTWMLPQHYVGSIGQPTEFLKMIFMALMDLTEPSLGVGKTLGEQGLQIRQEIAESIPGPTLLQAQKLMKKFLAKGENPNLSRWLVSAEHTAIRMGLLLCGDIHTAASAIKSDPVPLGKASVKEKVRELVLFSISEEYFKLREELGLAIGK